MGKQTKWMRQVGITLVVCLLCMQSIQATIPEKVLPGGMAFGVKIACNGLVIVGFTEVIDADNSSLMPAYDAGLRTGDRILTVDGNPISTSEEFLAILETKQNENKGTPMEIGYERGGKLQRVQFRPIYSPTEGKYKTGMWIRDTTAGIGTVTFLVPETGEFVGLGHGICDPSQGANNADAENTELLPMRRGKVIDVSISGVSKGIAGRPGELLGTFTEKETGVLLQNTNAGVYGIMQQIPQDKVPEPALELGKTDEIHTGDAYIWCTLTEGKPERFAIQITERMEQNFAIQVTDPTLIQKTGGIVQGMSGSPIIQDGKLIGAVTHVLISDPTRGYGIPVENMVEMVG